MATINHTFTLKITPEQFTNACGDIELFDLWMIMITPRIQQRLAHLEGFEPETSTATKRQGTFKSLLDQAKAGK